MTQNRTYKTIASIALLALFAVPAFVPSLHELLEHHHHHTVCTAQGVDHWHHDEADCQLCDFLVTVKPFAKEDTECKVSPYEILDNTFVAVEASTSVSHHTPHLRGPPGC